MDKCVQQIFQGVKNSKYIKQLNYSWNGLSGTDWIKSFKQGLIKNETLEILSMENNRLNKKSILLSQTVLFHYFYNSLRLTGVADQIMTGVMKSVSLRELYLGANPWREQDFTNILNTCKKPSNLNILGLGIHTYLTEDCVKVIFYVKTYLPGIYSFKKIIAAS